jgi:hypothetical protein
MLHSQSHPVRHVRRFLPDVLGLGGAVAGLFAALVMVLLSPLLSLLSGLSIWMPPKLIAATVYGPGVLATPEFAVGPVLVGVLLHVVTAVMLGVVFGVVYHRLWHLTTAFGTALLVGLCYGIVIFMGAYFLVLPHVNPLLTEAVVAPFLAQNLVFGLCLGSFYGWLRPQPYQEQPGRDRPPR